MPQLTIRGIEAQIVGQISHEVIPKLADLMKVSIDDFTIDRLSTVSYAGGQEVTTSPFIQIGWFDRGQEVQDLAAQIIDDALVKWGIHDLEIVFTPFSKSCYYSNGMHY